MKLPLRFLPRAAFAAVVLPLAASSAFAQGSPWIAEPRTGSITITYGHQAATEFYRADVKGPTPGDGANLSQTTGWIDANYAITDAIAVDSAVRPRPKPHPRAGRTHPGGELQRPRGHERVCYVARGG